MAQLHSTLVLDQEAINAPVSMQEQTRSQISIFNGPYGNIAALESMTPAVNGIVALGQNWRTGNYLYWEKVRRMRRHPTISLVRRLRCACMASANWAIEEDADAPDGSKDVLQHLIDFKNIFLSTALPGLNDWGWAPYEKVFEWDNDNHRTKLKKLKPLLQDYTRIMVTTQHGKFAGFKQFNKFLGTANSLLLNQQVEGTYLYGESTMTSIEPAYDRWLITDASNVTYDKKISGAHWVVHYPPGFSTLPGGVQKDNFIIAHELLKCLEGSGSVAVPNTVKQGVSDLNKISGENAWQIECVSADGSQGSFAQRMTYLDALMVRGGGFPERSILEGQYGTKAEAGEHADFAIMLLDFDNKCIADTLNWHLCNQLLRINLGMRAENKARIKVAPIADDKKDFLKQVMTLLLQNPLTSSQQASKIDMHAVRELLEIPMTDKTDEQDESLENMLQMLQQQGGMQEQQVDDSEQPIQTDANIQPEPVGAQ